MKQAIHTSDAPQATGPFSQAVAASNLIFTSGQIHLTAEGILLEGQIEEQTHQVMKNLQAILNEAGANFSNVVKSTIYVTDMSAYKKINEVYESYILEPYPAREVICVKALPLNANVEISMIAMK